MKEGETTMEYADASHYVSEWEGEDLMDNQHLPMGCPIGSSLEWVYVQCAGCVQNSIDTLFTKTCLAMLINHNKQTFAEKTSRICKNMFMGTLMSHSKTNFQRKIKLILSLNKGEQQMFKTQIVNSSILKNISNQISF